MYLFMLRVLSIILLCNKLTTNSAKILAIFHTPSKSHMVLAQPLMYELAKSGHEVYTVPNKKPPKNVKCIPLTGLETYYDKYFEFVFDYTEASPLEILREFVLDTDYANVTLHHPNVKKLLESNEQFDLLFMEIFQNDAFLGIAHHFDCPVVGMSTIGITPWVLHLVGAPAPMSFVPNGLLSFKDKMNLKERLINILFTFYERYLSYRYYFPSHEKIYNEAFPDPKPTLRELRESKVSLILLNSHFSLNVPRPYMPNMIEVGGMQVNSNPDPLSSELKKFIESAKDGVIFFSLGGNIWPSRMSNDKKHAILNSFSKIKQKIIWKWDDESLDVDTNKFLIKKWLPQNSILAHSNVKFFITHGGLLSVTESIYYGVPMIGIPIFGDQMANMNSATENGWGVRLDYTNVTEDSLDWALTELVGNPKYKDNVQKTSKIFRDQPLQPVDTAKFWIEYVIRHKDAPHIKSPAAQLTIIEMYNIDAYLILLFIGLLTILLTTIALQKLFKMLVHVITKAKID